MFFYLVMFLAFSSAYAGSSCPNRTQIYPCICMDKQIGKTKFHTMVVCQALTYSGSLKDIEANLSSMEIDKFLLYDSFWSTHPRMLQLNERVPANFITTFRAKELKVVDSTLSTFGCPHMDHCRTDYLRRFIAINTTATDNPNCTSIYSWISCPTTVEYIEINRCYRINHTLKPDFFPDPLTMLKALHMPYNHITRIDRRTFMGSKFPALETLDLSHNLLRDIRPQFITQLKVKYLDLSFNNIRNVVDFEHFPELQLLDLSNNHIMILLQSNWIHTPESLRTIDLSKNELNCNCENKWVNSTFHVSTKLMGHCATPPEVAKVKLRKASRLLIERCNENGTISASKIRSTTTTPTPQQ